MTEEDFARCVGRTRMRGLTIEAARLVLVEGWSQAEAARRCDRTREWARAAVARVERQLREEAGCPRDWRVVTVCLPEEAAYEVRTRAAALLDEYRRQRDG